MNNYAQEENKVNIEEINITLSCVKKETNEEVINFKEIPVKQEVSLEDDKIFQKTLYKGDLDGQENNLIDPLHTVIKLENVKEDDCNQLFCSRCNGNYRSYCLNCSTLSHILNRSVPLINCKSELATIPTGILEIRNTTRGKGVFLLRTVPKNVTFGPFEGISGIKSTEGCSWKINNKKLSDSENGNWMKHIVSAVIAIFKNLDIYQIEGNLYYKTNREIMEGEELLVYYDDEEIQRQDNKEDCYYTPQIQQKLTEIFACTLCCLGFSLDKFLIEHKRKCPHEDHNRNIDDLELIECYYCKIWLEKQEHQDHHMPYCQKRFHRMRSDYSEAVNRSETDVEEMESDSSKKYTQMAIEKTHKCSKCSYQTNNKQNLQMHVKRHIGIKEFQCDICTVKFTTKGYLKIHIKNQHADDGSAKDYKCSECAYQSNYKQHFQIHLNTHIGIKQFQCDICSAKFTTKRYLKTHTKNQHTDDGTGKDYKCSECSYQTNYKQHLNNHMNTHTGAIPIECGICMMKFAQKDSLRQHIKNKHTNDASVKNYKCSECSYQTNYKHSFEVHINKHRGIIKQYECDICMKKFTQNVALKAHIKNKHTSDGNPKDYKCSECSYQTNYKNCFRLHINKHRGIIKQFQCDICMMNFTQKGSLTKHVKNKHTDDGSAKNYKCSQCAYETNFKYNLQLHMNTHNKPYTCDICAMKFSWKNSLNIHIQKKHA